MGWTELRWSNACNANARLSDSYETTCQRKAGHGGKWHRDGEVRWRVARPERGQIAAEPHLHTLRLDVGSQSGQEHPTLSVPLPCGTGGQGRAFSHSYLLDGTTLVHISGTVT